MPRMKAARIANNCDTWLSEKLTEDNQTSQTHKTSTQLASGMRQLAGIKRGTGGLTPNGTFV